MRQGYVISVHINPLANGCWQISTRIQEIRGGREYGGAECSVTETKQGVKYRKWIKDLPDLVKRRLDDCV